MKTADRLARENKAKCIIDRNAKSVYRLAYSMTGSKEDAEDVMQETFMTCFSKPRIFNDEKHERRWLLKVAVNNAKDLLSKRRSRKEEPLPEDDSIGAPAGGEIKEESGVLEAVAKLSEPCRSCIHLFYCEGMPISVIANVLGLKPSTVKSHLKRGREKLKTILEE